MTTPKPSELPAHWNEYANNGDVRKALAATVDLGESDEQQAAARILAFLDGCSVTHNAGEGECPECKAGNYAAPPRRSHKPGCSLAKPGDEELC